ncbi:MAG: RagB/SusD family nutrient uptake outer membrane protein, partial [Caldilinea sp.]
DFPGKDHILAEAKFLRAYYYFELVKFFGDVPLVIDKRLGIEEVRTIDRSPKAEVYAQIEKDLKEAFPVLNPVASQKGRATRGAALALLGKAYVYQNKWAEASQTFDEVVNSGSPPSLWRWPTRCSEPPIFCCWAATVGKIRPIGGPM